MESNDQLAIVRTRRIVFYDLRHANGHLLTKVFDRAQADRLKAAFDAEHPDSPCLIQEQTAVVMPKSFYLSKRGKLHFKLPSEALKIVD